VSTLAWFWVPLTTEIPHVDEGTYQKAFNAVQEGRSPYTVEGYYYPPAFAYLGSWLDQTLGQRGTRHGFRILAVLAVTGSLWLSTAWWWRPGLDGGRQSLRAAWLSRLILAGLILVTSPGIKEGFHVGNLSFLTIGLALGGLASAGWAPWLAGPALASSIAFKPLIAVALPLLVLTPPHARSRSYRLTGLIGGALSCALLFGFPYLFEMLGQHIERLGRIRTWSVYRLVDVLGLGLDRLVIFATLSILAVVFCHQVRNRRESWLAVVLGASILTTPLIWWHTLILFFPVLVMTLSLARARWHHLEALNTPWAEPVFALLAVATIFFYNAGAIDPLPTPLVVLLLVVPIAALLFTVAYVHRTNR